MEEDIDTVVASSESVSDFCQWRSRSSPHLIVFWARALYAMISEWLAATLEMEKNAFLRIA
jgi:hypothetical protein